ncbi:hypothetical protein WJ32_28200 [Burkholderia ubonensis]|nr:hypothetical protein WJ32_28200 [Burkholderia ubonensis]
MLPGHVQAALTDVCVPVGTSTLQVAFPASIAAQRDAEIGTVLATRTLTTTIQCTNKYFPTGDTAHIFKSPYNSAVNSNGSAFETSVAGVGLQWDITNNYNNITYAFSSAPLNAATNLLGVPFPYVPLFPTTKTYTLTHTFNLIKTGPIVGGTFSFPKITMVNEPNSVMGGSYTKDLLSFMFSSAQIVDTSCNVTKKNIGVDMGRVPQGDFNGPGTTAQLRSFTIDLNCTPGAMINLTLDDTYKNASYPGTINLSDATAKGVGIQIVDAAQNRPFPIGETRPVGVASSGSASIGLGARYIQTGQTITGGKANSVLTFTVTYR